MLTIAAKSCQVFANRFAARGNFRWPSHLNYAGQAILTGLDGKHCALSGQPTAKESVPNWIVSRDFVNFGVASPPLVVFFWAAGFYRAGLSVPGLLRLAA